VKKKNALCGYPSPGAKEFLETTQKKGELGHTLFWKILKFYFKRKNCRMGVREGGGQGLLQTITDLRGGKRYLSARAECASTVGKKKKKGPPGGLWNIAMNGRTSQIHSEED